MSWNPNKFKLLGVWFTNNLEGMMELNLNDKFNEIKKPFNIWIKRSSTPIGRVVILKSLLLSKLIYLWIILPNPPDKFIKEVQEKCFQFVWDQKRDKIKRKISILHSKDGGIGIPEIETYIHALKITWVQRLTSESNAKWKHILHNINSQVKDIESIGTKAFKGKITNPFWNDVFNAYDKLDAFVKTTTPKAFLSEPIFLNEKFKINKRTIFIEEWFRNGVRQLNDIIKEDGSFLTLQEFEDKYAFRPNFLEFHGCKGAIKSNANANNIKFDNNDSYRTSKVNDLIKNNRKGSKTYYNIILNVNNKTGAYKNGKKFSKKK